VIARSSRNAFGPSNLTLGQNVRGLAANANPHSAAHATLSKASGEGSPRQHVPGSALLFLDPAACKLRAGRGGDWCWQQCIGAGREERSEDGAGCRSSM
jgi:hypothetical protein